ncbi:hypothetical protein [Pelagicoccus sp. SDUM812005]|uniref:hypothetical protein n=1 Tax=Pelagicoccus sp. SDUM812005 TaxID=3041257 RepID=UPI00280CCC27|nr:hypothetical protein [Pelagicoccus sp. SDUM812005]MDQ8180391.1 hypothetical protein [Pelagicoccus sp. SDUM812005]
MEESDREEILARLRGRGEEALKRLAFEVEAEGGFASPAEFAALIRTSESEVLAMLARGELIDASDDGGFSDGIPELLAWEGKPLPLLPWLLERADRKGMRDSLFMVDYLLADFELLGGRPLDFLREGSKRSLDLVEEHFCRFGEMGG